MRQILRNADFIDWCCGVFGLLEIMPLLVDNNPPINPQIEPVSAGVDASGIDVEQLLGLAHPDLQSGVG